MGVVDDLDKAGPTALGRRVTMAVGVCARKHGERCVADEFLHPRVKVVSDLDGG